MTNKWVIKVQDYGVKDGWYLSCDYREYKISG